MLKRPPACRVGIAVLAVVTLAGASAGCGSSGQHSGNGATSSTSKPAAAPTQPPDYDISRIGQLANEFPPDFSVTPIGPITLTQEQVDSFAGLTKKLGSTIEPAQCATALKHPHMLVGSVVQGFAAGGPQEIMVAAAHTPQPIPAIVQRDDCKHMTFNEPGKLQGTVDHIPPPTIDGLTVVAHKVHLDITEPGISKTVDQYQYQVALSDRTGVEVTGESDIQLLESLLTKAVTAIRGH
jgi:Domain of unknown function (DUF5642)